MAPVALIRQQQAIQVGRWTDVLRIHWWLGDEGEGRGSEKWLISWPVNQQVAGGAASSETRPVIRFIDWDFECFRCLSVFLSVFLSRCKLTESIGHLSTHLPSRYDTDNSGRKPNDLSFCGALMAASFCDTDHFNKNLFLSLSLSLFLSIFLSLCLEFFCCCCLVIQQR